MEEVRFWTRRIFLQVGHQWEPAVDVCEDDDAYHIIVDVAGVDEQDLEVEYHPNGSLVVRGVRRPPVTNAVQCLVLEIPYGAFERRIFLPSAVDAEGISATYRSGLLHIRVPKRSSPNQGRIVPVSP